MTLGAALSETLQTTRLVLRAKVTSRGTVTHLATLSASRHCVLRVVSGGECRGCVVEAAEDDGSETSRWWLVNKSRPTRFVDCKPRAFALVWYVTWTASHRRWQWQGGLATSPQCNILECYITRADVNELFRIALFVATSVLYVTHALPLHILSFEACAGCVDTKTWTD